MHKKKIIIITFVVAFLLIIFFVINNDNSEVAADSDVEILEQKPLVEEVKIEEKNIYVEIKGAVISPGVYMLKDESRVIDLINAAGGLTDDANIDYINQSKILEDQMVIKIYTNKEIEDSNKVEVVTRYVEKECNCPKIQNDACIDNIDDNQNTTSNGLVNINSCTLEELLTLPGIGESKAQAIFDYRKTSKFNTIEDIKNVTGIGQSLYDKIKDYIEV